MRRLHSTLPSSRCPTNAPAACNQRLGTAISGDVDAFPTCPSAAGGGGGWNGGKITTKTLSEIGGGQGAERNYRKGDKEDPKSLTATVSIISGSPAMTQISGFLSNPALGVLIGAKSQQVGSTTAMVIPKEGLLQMVVQDKFVIAVRGKKLSEAQLAELAAGVNQDVLKALK